MTVDGRPARVTSRDVARTAGVSRATVSYVLNDTPHQRIPEATRQRVLDAAASLGYAPSAAARALRLGRSDVVLALLPDMPIGSSAGSFLEHTSAALAADGLTLLVHPRSDRSRSVSELLHAVSAAAVIAFEDISDAEADRMRASGVEVHVALLAGSPNGRARRPGRRPAVLAVPQQRSGRLQAEHLAAAGHRHLGYACPDDPRVRDFAEHRLDGVRTACADLGLDGPVVQTVPLDPAAAAEAVASWRSSDPAVTGVCAYNDEVALALLAGLRRLGLSAPQDLAVIGVDDIPGAALAAPPLTTVTTDATAIADYVARTVISSLHGRPAPRRPGSDIGHVIVRESA